MKKIRTAFIILLGIILIPFTVHAATGRIAVSGTNTVVAGNKVTVNVTLSSSAKIGSWQMSLKYDKSYLQLTGSTAEAGGTMMASSSATGVKTKTYTFTFKTLKTGTTNVSVDSFLAYAFDDLSQISLTSSGKSIRIITQQELEASYSKNNDLSSLTVEGFELNPVFNKDTLEYTVTVPEDTKEINIGAKVSDNRSTVTGVGTQEVTSGTNTFEIIVKAQNGAEKTYKIIVDVKDENPINVTVDGKKYTVVKIKENLPVPNAYQEHTVKINEFEIPAFKSDNTGLILVGLKNESGEINLFIYDEAKKTYQAYHEIGKNTVTVYPLDSDETLKGYQKEDIEINGAKIKGYTFDKSSRYVILYGVNVETGEKGFYVYDKEDQSVMKYNDEYIKVLEEKINLYSYIIIGFSVLLFIVLLLLIFKKPKKGKKKNPKVTKITFDEKEEPTNEIVEIKAEENKEEQEEPKKKKKK